ncbi:TPA: ankyrin repeat domain-containing protein, partial [Mannheimia haemolytica]|nr:ankyrin repeat domain-containing protein [Mannheimia haemolytica]
MNELYEKYKDEPSMLVAIADGEGNIGVLEDIFLYKKQLAFSYVTPLERWNWLHQCNLNSYAPAPLSVIEFYIQNGVEINAQDCYGMTPLHYAMRAKNVDAAIALLNAGADP